MHRVLIVKARVLGARVLALLGRSRAGGGAGNGGGVRSRIVSPTRRRWGWSRFWCRRRGLDDRRLVTVEGREPTRVLLVDRDELAGSTRLDRLHGTDWFERALLPLPDAAIAEAIT